MLVVLKKKSVISFKALT